MQAGWNGLKKSWDEPVQVGWNRLAGQAGTDLDIGVG